MLKLKIKLELLINIVRNQETQLKYAKLKRCKFMGFYVVIDKRENTNLTQNHFTTILANVYTI